MNGSQQSKPKSNNPKANLTITVNNDMASSNQQTRKQSSEKDDERLNKTANTNGQMPKAQRSVQKQPQQKTSLATDFNQKVTLGQQAN